MVWKHSIHNFSVTLIVVRGNGVLLAYDYNYDNVIQEILVGFREVMFATISIKRIIIKEILKYLASMTQKYSTITFRLLFLFMCQILIKLV